MSTSEMHKPELRSEEEHVKTTQMEPSTQGAAQGQQQVCGCCPPMGDSNCMSDSNSCGKRYR
jgi:hypothetical protein